MALSDATSSAHATIGIEAMETFADEVRSIAGRPPSPDLLRFLSLATHLGAATAKMKGVRPEAPAHWDSLFAALMISPEPVCRFVRWRLEEALEAQATALELSILPDPSRRGLALSDSAEGPAQRGGGGFFTPSARSQIQFASENYSTSEPILSLGAFLEALILRPASGHEKRSEDIQPRIFSERIMQWRADSQLDAGQEVGGIANYAARSRLIEAMLSRTQPSRSGEDESSIPLLAALVGEVASRHTPENEELARLARKAFPANSDVTVWRFHGALTLIMRADAIVQRLGDSEIDCQHLAVAALAPDIPQLPPLAVPPEELNEPATLKQIRSKALDLIADAEADSGRVELWMDLLSGERLRRVSIVSDSSVGDDLLDFTRYARAIATVIADKDVVPPLAIGLFGPWGSGKSAMIAMVKAQLDEIEQRARRGRRDEFCRGIVKVEFNAWHYAESNLWASLFVCILEAVSRYVNPQIDSTPGAEQRAKLLIELDEAILLQQMAATELLKRQSTAVEKEQIALTAAKAAESKKCEAQARAEEQRARAISAKERVNETQQRLKQLTSDTIEVISLLGGKPIPDLSGKDGKELADAFNAAKSEIESASKSLMTIRAKLRSAWKTLHIQRKGAALALFVAAGLITLLIGYAANAGMFSWLAATILGVTSAIRPMFPHWHRFSDSLKIVEHYSAQAAEGAKRAQELTQQRNDEREKAKELDGYEKEVEAAREASKRAHEEAETARIAAEQAAEASLGAERSQQRVMALEAQIAALAPSKLLESFVNARSSSDDYSRHLGLPTLIRRDIEGLRRHLQALHNADSNKAEKTHTSHAKSIDRIVLFVDDLDRCRPEVVVRVLEAIHILLTFDLFEVVVGVDVRWLRRALDRYHAGQFGEGGPLDPLEYLEKIFQVPFWIPTMAEGGRKSIVDSALPKASEPVIKSEVNQQNTSEARNVFTVETQEKLVKKKNFERGNSRNITLPLPPLEPLTMVIEERACLLHIGNLAGDTPRRLKRFARSYLILRAALSPDQQVAYIKDEGWCVVAWMMAIGCALPQHWGSFTDAVRWQSTDDTPFAEWMDLPGAIIDAHRAALFAVQKKFGTRESWPDRELCQKWLTEVSRFGFSTPEE